MGRRTTRLVDIEGTSPLVTASPRRAANILNVGEVEPSAGRTA
jgi:hypothetical protein